MNDIYSNRSRPWTGEEDDLLLELVTRAVGEGDLKRGLDGMAFSMGRSTAAHGKPAGATLERRAWGIATRLTDYKPGKHRIQRTDPDRRPSFGDEWLARHAANSQSDEARQTRGGAMVDSAYLAAVLGRPVAVADRLLKKFDPRRKFTEGLIE